MRRLYLAKMETLNSEFGFKPGATGAAWINILGKEDAQSATVRYIVDSREPAVFAIGILDVDATQHASLISDNSRIRHVPASLFATEYDALNAGQKNSVQQVETFLGFPIITNTVEDIIWKIAGRAVSKGVDELSDLI